MATSKKSSPSKRKTESSKATAEEETVVQNSDHGTDAETAKSVDTVVGTEETAVVDDSIAAGTQATEEVVEPTAPEPEAMPAQEEPAASAPVAVEAKQSSGFFPMVLGGVVAGGIGFFAAQYGLFGNQSQDQIVDLRNDMGAQQDRITELETAEAPSVDLSPLEASLADLDARLKALEDRPAVVGTDGVDVDAVAAAATAAYAKELEGLRASVETQRSEIQDLLENAKSVEQATSDAATRASAQTALAKIVSALDAGQPFVQPLADLMALDIGEVDPALAAVSEKGGATLSMLQSEFPEQARTALAVARASGAEEGQQGLGSFLKRSLGARSVTPQEGDDPDAVLSRAEAAINSGDLTATLTELDALPEDAQAAIGDWRAAADAHLDARKAADALAQRLTAD